MAGGRCATERAKLTNFLFPDYHTTRAIQELPATFGDRRAGFPIFGDVRELEFLAIPRASYGLCRCTSDKGSCPRHYR